MNTLTTQEAKDITLRYLVALYGQETGIKMFAESQSRIFDYHGLAWALGKQCFPYFCEIFLHNLLFDYSGDCVPLSDMHYDIWNELNDVILHRNNTRNVYVFPRSFGKSTTITIPLALWCALYCFHPFIVVDSATEKQSENFINTMKVQLEDNHYIKDCFGEIINRNLKYNTSEIELDIQPQRSKIQCVSSTSSVRGINYGSFRVGLLILDDTQDDKQVTTDAAAAELVERIDSGIMKALQMRNNHVVALGTVKRKGDLYDTFIHRPTWKARVEKCIRMDDIDAYFRNNEHWKEVMRILQTKSTNNNAVYDAENYYIEHQAEMDYPLIWENYDCYRMAMDYYANPVSFKREYQCDISSLGEKRITSLSAIPAKEIESIPYVKTILSIDPAASNNKKSDYYAFCVMGQAENYIKYARKSLVLHMEYDDYIEKVIELLKEYPDIMALSVEKNTYMGADVLKIRERIAQEPELINRPLVIINKQRSKNKDNRINAICPDINMARIIFNEDDVDAIEQIKEFAGCAYTEHDDMIDTVADCIENLAELKNPVPRLQVLDFSVLGL